MRNGSQAKTYIALTVDLTLTLTLTLSLTMILTLAVNRIPTLTLHVALTTIRTRTRTRSKNRHVLPPDPNANPRRISNPACPKTDYDLQVRWGTNVTSTVRTGGSATINLGYANASQVTTGIIAERFHQRIRDGWENRAHNVKQE